MGRDSILFYLPPTGALYIIMHKRIQLLLHVGEYPCSDFHSFALLSGAKVVMKDIILKVSDNFGFCSKF